MLSEAFLQRLDALQLAMRAPARGGAGGLRRSRALGSSVEFSDFREYAPGDDLRRVDWNAYARFDRLFLKLFMEEQETTVHILLDCSASMDFGEPSKWEMAQGLAQLLCYMAIRGGDRAVIIGIAHHNAGKARLEVGDRGGKAEDRHHRPGGGDHSVRGLLRPCGFYARHGLSAGLVAQGTAAFVPADAARATAAGTRAMLRHQRSDERGWL